MGQCLGKPCKAVPSEGTSSRVERCPASSSLTVFHGHASQVTVNECRTTTTGTQHCPIAKPVKEPNKSDADAVTREHVATVRTENRELKEFIELLNNVTPQNREVLLPKISHLIYTEDALKQILEHVFRKTFKQPAVCVQFAMFCKNLCSILEINTVNGETKQDEKRKFRELLLSRCQKEFETDVYSGIGLTSRPGAIESSRSSSQKELSTELDQKNQRAMVRRLGLMRFIGELFKQDLLKGETMVSLIQRLVSESTDESLKCLCTLLRTVGGQLEDECRTNTTIKMHWESCLSKLVKIIEEKQSCEKVRVLIQNVLGLRACGWSNGNKSKTLVQIHAVETNEQNNVSIEKQNQNSKSRKVEEARKLAKNKSPPAKMQHQNNTKPMATNQSRNWAKNNVQKRAALLHKKSIVFTGNRNQTSQKSCPKSGAVKQRRARRARTMLASQSGSPKPQPRNQKTNRESRGTGQVIVRDRDWFSNATCLPLGPAFQDKRPSDSAPSQLNTGRGSPASLPPVTIATFIGSVHISAENFERRTKKIVNEFNSRGLPGEISLSVLELCTEKNVHHFVNQAINLSLTGKREFRLSVAKILNELFVKKVISTQTIADGLASDVVVEIVKFCELVGQTLCLVYLSLGFERRQFILLTLPERLGEAVAGKLVASMQENAKLATHDSKTHKVWYVPHKRGITGEGEMPYVELEV